jgi:hypothetical protein
MFAITTQPLIPPVLKPYCTKSYGYFILFFFSFFLLLLVFPQAHHGKPHAFVFETHTHNYEQIIQSRRVDLLLPTWK